MVSGTRAAGVDGAQDGQPPFDLSKTAGGRSGTLTDCTQIYQATVEEAMSGSNRQPAIEANAGEAAGNTTLTIDIDIR